MSLPLAIREYPQYTPPELQESAATKPARAAMRVKVAVVNCIFNVGVLKKVFVCLGSGRCRSEDFEVVKLLYIFCSELF